MRKPNRGIRISSSSQIIGVGEIVVENITETPLTRINVIGGDVLHAMKKQDLGYSGFGEAYFSWVNPGSIKAWKLHSSMVLNLIVPVGNVRFVFLSNDSIGRSTSKKIEIGDVNYSRITVPPGIWFGFQGIDTNPSLILNLSNIEHDPNEVKRLPIEALKFDWS